VIGQSLWTIPPAAIARTGLIVVPEIAPFPGLDKVGPGDGIEDILWGRLTLIIVPGGILAEVGAGRLACAGRESAGQNASLCRIGVLARYFYVVIRNGSVHKIPLELLPGRSWFDDGGGEVLSVLHHQLYDTVLITMECVRDIDEDGFIAYAGKFHLVAFQHYDGKYPLVAGISTLVTSLDDNAHSGYAFEAVCRHDDAI